MIDIAQFNAFCSARSINPATKLGRLLRQDPVPKARRKQELFADQHGLCPLCGQAIERSEVGEIDHVREVAHFVADVLAGGDYATAYDALHSRNNLRLTHKACNANRNRKSSTDIPTR